MPSTSRRNKRADKRADRRHADEMMSLLRAVLESPGATEPALRQASYRGDLEAGPVEEYVAKIRGQSYRVSDADVRRLLETGYSEDAIFELTIAAALGAAGERLEAGMRALHAMREER